MFQHPANADIARFASQGGHRYVLENVRGGLDQAGEVITTPTRLHPNTLVQFYIDKHTKTVYYMPYPGETAKTLHAVLPRLTTLISVSNSAHLVFKGLTLVHGTRGIGPFTQYFSSEGVVEIENALDISVVECDIGLAG